MGQTCSRAAHVEDVSSPSSSPGTNQAGRPKGIGEEVLRDVRFRGLQDDEAANAERRLLSGEAGPSPNTLGAKPPRGKWNRISPLQHRPSASLGKLPSNLSSGRQQRGTSSPAHSGQGGGTPSSSITGGHPFVGPNGHSMTAGHALRLFSCEELQELGFLTVGQDNLAKVLPTASKQPVAILALEQVEAEPSRSVRISNLPGEVLEDGFGPTPATPGPGRKLRNKLVPVFINTVCRSYFGIKSHKDYADVIRKLLKRDPLLTFALQKALRYLKAGEAQSVSHVTPDPSGQTSSLYGLRVTPCVFNEGGRLQAAMLIEHNAPYNPAEVMPRLMRDYAVLSHVPAILTLIDFQGKVLYQNASSLSYMGDLLSVKYDNRLSDGLLRVLFMYDLHNLEQMLEDVLNGQEWQGVVQVPVSLRRYLAANQASDAPLDMNGSFSAHARPSMNDDLEVEFQIGNSFTTRGLAGKHRKQQQAGYLMGGRGGPGLAGAGAMSRNFSIREGGSVSFAQHLPPGLGGSPPGGPGGIPSTSVSGALVPPGSSSPDDGGSFTHEGGGGPGPFAAHAGPSVLSEHPQRKFMTLLDRRGLRASTDHPAVSAGSMTAAQLAELQAQAAGGPDGLGPQSAPSLINGPTGLGPGGEFGSNGPEGLEPVDEDDASYDETQECYHEIHAIPLLDPVLDKQVIMLVQTDVTPRVELENKLADLTDAQLSMLEQLFPRHIIEYMLARVPSKGGRNLRDLANTHEQVMVLFCDVVGFTSMSKEVEPSQVMHFLNELYEGFDELVDEYDMYKLDIVGDCYIVVAGLIKEDQDGFVCVDEMDEDQVINNAVRIMQFAKAMLRESQPVLMPHNSEPVQLRIGIHTGPLVSGLVGAKMPKFTLFGDTMNTSSRMESTCRPGCVHVSDAFAKLLPHEHWESTGGVQVKGKGMMQTYLWVPGADEQINNLQDMDPESAVRNLRRSLSRMNSFTSMKSRFTIRGSSTGEDSDSDGKAANPLLKILTNIRGGGGEELAGGQGGDDSEDDLPLAGQSDGRPSGRPVSARPRKARASHVGGPSAHYSGDLEAAGGGSGHAGRGSETNLAGGGQRHTSRRPSEGFRLTQQRRGRRMSAAHGPMPPDLASHVRKSIGQRPPGVPAFKEEQGSETDGSERGSPPLGAGAAAAAMAATARSGPSSTSRVGWKDTLVEDETEAAQTNAVLQLTGAPGTVLPPPPSLPRVPAVLVQTAPLSSLEPDSGDERLVL